MGGLGAIGEFLSFLRQESLRLLGLEFVLNAGANLFEESGVVRPSFERARLGPPFLQHAQSVDDICVAVRLTRNVLKSLIVL